jgi:hypothetical protein
MRSKTDQQEKIDRRTALNLCAFHLTDVAMHEDAKQQALATSGRCYNGDLQPAFAQQLAALGGEEAGELFRDDQASAGGRPPSEYGFTLDRTFGETMTNTSSRMPPASTTSVLIYSAMTDAPRMPPSTTVPSKRTSNASTGREGSVKVVLGGEEAGDRSGATTVRRGPAGSRGSTATTGSRASRDKTRGGSSRSSQGRPPTSALPSEAGTAPTKRRKTAEEEDPDYVP